jgi:hypothetical protein
MSAAKPGWYPDPAADREHGPITYRWWDGSQWSDATGESAQAPRPVPDAPAPGVRQAGTRAGGRWTLCLALAATLALVAGLLLWRETDRPPSDSAGAGATRAKPQDLRSSRGPVGQLDETTRQVSIGSASMTLPDDPYVLYREPMRIPGLLDEFFQANAVVHPRYDANRDWSAVVGLADVNAARTQAAQLDRAAATALRRFARVAFGGKPTTVRKVRTRFHPLDGRPGVLLTAEVHYTVPELASRYDRVTAVLVRLDDGSVVAAFSSIPDDAPNELTRLAKESLATLQIG